MQLIDPAVYQDFADAHRCTFRAKLWDQETAEASPHRRKQKQHIRRQQLKIWSPFGKQAMLTGVVVPDRLSGTDVTHTDPVDVLAALRAHWAPVFSKKDTNPTPQRAQLKFCPKLDPTTPMPIPDLAAVERFLKKAKPSAPGPDGLPYAAWLAAGEGAWSALIELWQWTTFGRPLPDGFNKSLAVFPGKGKMEGDENGITRKPGDTRPISLMNTDSKVLAAITDRGISRVAQAVVTPLQCGFIKHRPIIDNVVDLDGAVRRFSMQACDVCSRYIASWPP